MSFELPRFDDHPIGWGPSNQRLPEAFADMPFLPFNKGDKIGRAADWTIGQQYAQRRQQATVVSGTEEDSFFHVVGGASARKAAPLRPMQRQLFRGAQQDRTPQGAQQQRQQTQNPNQQQFQQYRQRPGGMQRQFQRLRDASVEVRFDWKVLEELEFSRLTKLSYQVGEFEDVGNYGVLESYEKSFDRISTKSEKLVTPSSRVFPRVTASEDHVLNSLARSSGARVFFTDDVLSQLMACTRSVYSWDLIINRVGDKLFFDKRDGSQIDMLTVNETAAEPPADDKEGGINTASALATEATQLDRYFRIQALSRSSSDADRLAYPHSNPFTTGPHRQTAEELAPIAYRYRKVSLGNDVTAIVRTEVDAVLRQGAQDSLITLRCLNEYDPKAAGNVNWRQKLDSQRGAVLTAELRNNSNKFTKWTIQALLSGTDQLKIGYATRVNAKDPSKHSLLAVQSFKPRELANQINFNVNNAWGIVKWIVDYALNLPEGKYLLLRDPNKAVMRLYDVPSTTFEEGN